MKRTNALLVLSLLISFSTFAQSPFSLFIEPITIPDLGGLQSFAFGQHDGKWLIVGGRLDGLHRRQPFASFDIAGHNNQLFVVDPVSKLKWTAPLSALPTSIQEQLSATNLEFHQEDKYLYIVGGYGFSATINDHTTYPNLTAIDVPATINAIISASSYSSYFRQINDPLFAVTGGHLKKINNSYYLVGGQKFIGRYNPMGPTSGPGFIQEYTNAIRKFNLTDDGTTITISHLPSFFDTINLHRRDYNVAPQILPSGAEGLTAFSGVFKYTANLPYLDCVHIDSIGYNVDPSFSQYYNHYHCANIPLYSESKKEMHHLFFGGIAQYYDNMGTLVKDDNVPFVKTIARVTRDASGKMTEYKLPLEMPEYLGAGSEFIPIETLKEYKNGVIKLDSLINDTSLLGYIFGGINSSDKNIFFINTGTQSKASNQIFKVYLVKSENTSIHFLNPQSIGNLKMQVAPNPSKEHFNIYYNLFEKSDVQLTISDETGRTVEIKMFKDQQAGNHHIEQLMPNIKHSGYYLITIKTKNESATQKIITHP